MAVWAINAKRKLIKRKYEKFKKGKFIYDYVFSEDLDLNLLKEKSWDEMYIAEKEIWEVNNFLLNIKEGDWIIIVDMPEYGECITGKVKRSYYLEEDEVVNAFAFCFDIDVASIVEFKLNDFDVDKLIAKRLSFIDRFRRIYYEEEFFSLIEKLKKSGEEDRYISGVDVFKSLSAKKLNEFNDFIKNLKIKMLKDIYDYISQNLELEELFEIILEVFELIKRSYDFLDIFLTEDRENNIITIKYKIGFYPLGGFIKSEEFYVIVRSKEIEKRSIESLINEFKNMIAKYSSYDDEEFSEVKSIYEKAILITNVEYKFAKKLEEELSYDIKVLTGENLAEFLINLNFLKTFRIPINFFKELFDTKSF